MVVHGANDDDSIAGDAAGEQLRDVQRRRGAVNRLAAGGDGVADESAEAHPSPPAFSAALGRGKNRLGPVQPQSKRGNLPAELTRFVGRRNELAVVKNSFSSGGVTTLTGIGGVGKTRLALQTATDVRREFDDGVWLAELSELSDPELVVTTVSDVLGLREQSARSLAQLTDHLAGKRALLILDNCEHLLRPIVVLVDALTRKCPSLQVLATSREPLGANGEVVVRVSPMTVPDLARTSSLCGLPGYEAVELFVDRAALMVPGFELTEENSATVAQICVRLDGLPLSIELAAARLRAMSANQMLDRLNLRYQLFLVGMRSAPTRQQTMRSSIKWSYDLCTAREQQLWSELAVFSHSFELDAAEAVCAGGVGHEDMFVVVTSLVDKSILIREEIGEVVRYRMLDLLHDFAREKLSTTGEWSDLLKRYQQWYEQLAYRTVVDAISPRQLELLNRLEREQTNFRAALQSCMSAPSEPDVGLRMAGGLFPFWLFRGHLAEGRLWFGRVLAAYEGEPQAAQAQVLYLNSLLAGMQGDLADAITQLTAADEIATRDPDITMSALAEFARGSIALFHTDPGRAVTHFQAVDAANQAEGDLFWRVGSLLGLGLAYVQLGVPVAAVASYERLLTLTEKHGERVYRGRAALVGGWGWWRQGELQRAQTILRRGLCLSSCAGDPVGISRTVLILAWIEAEINRADRAAMLLGAAAVIWRESGGPTADFLEQLPDHFDCIQSSRQTLGDREFERQFHEGGTLGLAGAVEYALDEKRPTHGPQPSGPTPLTRREWQVAELVATGLTNREVADRLFISPRTAQGHVAHILSKLGFTSRTHIAAWIAEHGERGI